MKRFLANVTLLVVAILVCAQPVQAVGDDDTPTLEQFTQAVMNGDPNDLRGLYVNGLLANLIVRQPADMPAFVSDEDSVLTRFGMAEDFGSLGLLAHNYLAGGDFDELEKGSIIFLVYGDGSTRAYVVKQILLYQALTPHSLTSDFVDLQTGRRFSTSQLFLKVFDRPGDVILQTCIEQDGNASWGRMFIIAVPFPAFDFISLHSLSILH